MSGTRAGAALSVHGRDGAGVEGGVVRVVDGGRLMLDGPRGRARSTLLLAIVVVPGIVLDFVFGGE